jgi:hypothetical protein
MPRDTASAYRPGESMTYDTAAEISLANPPTEMRGQWRRIGIERGRIKERTGRQRSVGMEQAQPVCTSPQGRTDDIARFQVEAVEVHVWV